MRINSDVIRNCNGVNEFKHVVFTALEKNLFVYHNLFSPLHINFISLVQYILRILNIIWWEFDTVRGSEPDYLDDYHVLLEYVKPFKYKIHSKQYNNMLSFMTSLFNNAKNNFILGNIILNRAQGMPLKFRGVIKFNTIIDEIKKYISVLRCVIMSFDSFGNCT